MRTLARPKNQTTYGDTTYITIPTKTLPLLRPLLDIGKSTKTMGLVKPLVDLISPVLRVLIDTGYNRNLSPGVPAPFELIPWVNPIKLAVDLVRATGAGIQAAINDITGKAKSTAGTPATVAATPSVTATTRPLTLVPTAAATTPTAKPHAKKPAAAVKTVPDPAMKTVKKDTSKKDSSAKKGKATARPVASTCEKKAA